MIAIQIADPNRESLSEITLRTPDVPIRAPGPESPSCPSPASPPPPPVPLYWVSHGPAPISRPWRQRFEAKFASRQQSAAVQALRDELAASGLRESDAAAYRYRTFELSVAGYFADPRAARALTPFRVTARVQQSTWDSLGDFDLTTALRDVRCPALVVHGRQDPIPLESSAAVAEALEAGFVVLDDCGNVPYVEQPAERFCSVRGFLDRTSPTPA